MPPGREPTVTITSEPPDSADATRLIDELTAELEESDYPPQSVHGYSARQLIDSGVAFFVARVDGRPAGCGGVQLVRDAGAPFAELKRMYVRPAERGCGVAEQILRRLVEHAAAQGVAIVRLETGVRQHAAIRFYRRSGFVEIGPFGSYREDPESLYLERRGAADGSGLS